MTIRHISLFVPMARGMAAGYRGIGAVPVVPGPAVVVPAAADGPDDAGLAVLARLSLKEAAAAAELTPPVKAARKMDLDRQGKGLGAGPAETFRAMAAVRFGRDGKPVAPTAPAARASRPKLSGPGVQSPQPGDPSTDHQADGQAPSHQAR